MASSPQDGSAAKDGTTSVPATGEPTAKIPPELRFLIEQAGDAEEGHRILQAYYSFAGGTPESATVQFALLATALARANLAAVAKLTDLAQQPRSGAKGSGGSDGVGLAVREALKGFAAPLDQLHADVRRLHGDRRGRHISWWLGLGIFVAGLAGGYLLHR